jgi:type II secretory pathway component PulL
VLAIGLCGHLAMLIADTLALQSIADARRNETRGLVAAAAPGRWGGDDIMTVAMDLLPRDGDRGSGQLLPLLGRASIGLASLPPGVALRTLRFDAAGGTLMLDVDAPQAALIDRAARALGARPTPPIIEGGLARATLTLRDGPAT